MCSALPQVVSHAHRPLIFLACCLHVLLVLYVFDLICSCCTSNIDHHRSRLFQCCSQCSHTYQWSGLSFIVFCLVVLLEIIDLTFWNCVLQVVVLYVVSISLLSMVRHVSKNSQIVAMAVIIFGFWNVPVVRNVINPLKLFTIGWHELCHISAVCLPFGFSFALGWQ